MAYSIGQFRKSQLDFYYQNQSNFNTSTLSNNILDYNVTSSSLNFTNKLISLSQKLVIGNCYYLKVTANLKETPGSSSRGVNISLNFYGNENSTSSSSKQSVKTISVSSVETKTFELSFVAEQDFQYILFSITRTSEDNKNLNSQGTYGSLFDTFVVESLYQIPNTINILKAIDSNAYGQMENIKKLGIQAPTGFQFNIDGQNIKVGNSGIYQINNGYIIKEIYFLPDSSDYFIMDFEY